MDSRSILTGGLNENLFADYGIHSAGLASPSSGAPVPIVPPDAAFNFVPFDIFVNGGVVTIDPDFNLRTYANVSVTKTYYVKPEADGGSDGANGLTEGTAFASINRGLSRSDTDRVMIKAGVYGVTTHPSSHSWNNQSPARDVEVIGYGGDVVSSSHVELASLTWGVVDNHWEVSYATTISAVWDNKTPDAFGDAVQYPKQTSIAEVDALAGSWWYDSVADVLYVRTLDSREPDADIYPFIGVPNGRINDANTYYVEGVDFYGGSNSFLGSSGALASKAYFKNCEFKYAVSGDMFAFTGGTGEVILENCLVAKGTADNIHFEDSGGSNTNLIMIDVISRDAGEAGDTNANSYSRHGPGNTVIINNEFYNTYGPNMLDITASTFTWILGTYGHDSLISTFSYGISGAGSKMWLDTCIAEDGGASDIYANTDAFLYYRDMTPSTPSTSGAGSFSTY